MVETRNEFRARLRTLGRKHRAMANGASSHLREDGLIVVRPHRRKAQRTHPMRMLLLLLVSFFVLKGYMLAALGDAGYQDRLTKLQSGTSVEQVGATVMRPDRVSVMFANLWQQVLGE